MPLTVKLLDLPGFWGKFSLKSRRVVTEPGQEGISQGLYKYKGSRNKKKLIFLVVRPLRPPRA